MNGNSATDNFWGSTPGGNDLPLDLETIDRIEVVRGPGSALYGTNAVLAVINIITKEGKDIDGLRVNMQAGSFGRLVGGIRYGKEFKNGIDVLVSGQMGDVKGQDLYFEEYDDPATNHGVAEGLDWEKYSEFFGSLKYKHFTLHGLFTSREKGIPTAAYATAFNDDRQKTLDLYTIVDIKYEDDISFNKKLMIRGYFNSYEYKGGFPCDDPDYRTVQWDHSIGEWLGIQAQFNWDFRAHHRLILGGEYRYHLRAYYRLWDEYETYFDHDYPFHEFSFFAQDEYQFLENLSLTLGIRYDKYSDRGDSLTPRAALVYNPFRSTTVKFLYGNAFRAPNLYELYYEAVDENKANPLVRPEKVRTIELVWEQDFNRNMRGILSLYSYSMRDLIEQVPDPADGLRQFQNLDRVKGTGIEIELKARLDNGFLAYASYVFQETRNIRLDEEMSNSPHHIFKSGVSIPILKKFFASVENRFESGRLTVYGDRTKPYFLTNIHLVSTKLAGHFKTSFLVKNLFNVDYSTPGGYEHSMSAIRQDGRNFTVKLEWEL